MSSEMRELVAKYEKRLANWTRLYNNEEEGAWNRAHMLQCRDIVDDLRALLARTEAGADRPVAEISELSGAKLIVLYSVDEIGHLPKGTKLYTHPQDASAGDRKDAARWRCLLSNWKRDHIWYHVFFEEDRDGHSSIESVVDAALHQPAKGGAL